MEKKPEYFKTQSEFFKILSHPVRLEIMEILREEDACVCHINAILNLRQAYVSQQLAVLREAGFIEDRKCGWNVYYRVSNPAVFAVIDEALRCIDPSHQLERPELSVPEDCPCPRCKESECCEETETEVSQA
ncbi:MAG: winged helix-turn-helix transcriptional regulator [Anaerolineaceae bacterium]|nr:winged helix-turn-helix transcriptional regulator [Anaerolineaceae bacterium]